jgi:hypothetical protein
VHNPLAAWRDLDGIVVVISAEDSILHELNETASFIWKLSTGERTTREIARLLAEEFDVDLETALTDTRALVEELLRKNILHLASDRAAEVSRG